MVETQHKITLSTTEPNNHISLVRVRQDDTQTQKLIVEVTENGQLKPFEGLAVEFINNTRIDSSMPVVSKVTTTFPEQARIEYVLQSQDLQWIGENTAYFNFIDKTGKKIFSTREFCYRVERGVNNERIKDSGYIWRVKELINTAKELVNKVSGILDSDVATSLAKEIASHELNTENPHEVDKRQVGLSEVPNYGAATKEEAISGKADNKILTASTARMSLVTELGKRFHFKGTQYSAHRGNCDFPENTSMAIKQTKRHNFVEFDVQTTSDGKWIVMHDATVDRMTNGTGRVDEMTYEQIRELRIDVGSNIGVLPDWERVIPNLDEAIKYSKMSKSIPMIEIKVDEGTTYTDEELMDFVSILHANNLIAGGCIVISFSEDILKRIRALSDSVELMWVTYGVYDGYLEKCIQNRMGIDPQYNDQFLTRETVQEFHNHGLLVSVWTASEEHFSSLEDKGVDIITTGSRSGDLKYGDLNLKNGFTNVSWAGHHAASVEQISESKYQINFVLENGSNTSGTLIATFPNWAIPYISSLRICDVRTENGVEFGTVDIRGTLEGEAGLYVGLNWNNRTRWVSGQLDFSII